MSLVNKRRSLIEEFTENPQEALDLANAACGRHPHGREQYLTVTPQEALQLFPRLGIEVRDIYAIWGWADVGRFPKEILDSREWDGGLFDQSKEMAKRMARAPSIQGMTRHLMVYGEKLA